MLIYGWRKSVQELATATYLCGNCQNPSAHALRRAVTKFTLFFIPLFPISSKYFTVCTFCGMTNKLTKDEAQQVQAMQQQAPQPVPQQPPVPQAGYPQAGHPQAGYPQPGHAPQQHVQQYPQQQIQPPRQGF
ncbi:zinc-ribbon domain-containing protein [Amycolatopsis tucumanensis]|uniref:Zinc-ribbon domain-containing protein n=1 Tax=Amycolatopsis tucumanensis TaxID=401106 RepID=A0ABP7I4T7_9PSEU|nr:zinc-ribbon domain-containing protein [Amycolatopsis tucumanensis]MCF6423023.1 zinc ribbon domain-containing protein [Amycolatopsis tucumanensis]